MEKSVQHHIQTAVTPSKESAAGLNSFDGKEKSFAGSQPTIHGLPSTWIRHYN
jgi:hypothetical protein